MVFGSLRHNALIRCGALLCAALFSLFVLSCSQPLNSLAGLNRDAIVLSRPDTPSVVLEGERSIVRYSWQSAAGGTDSVYRWRLNRGDWVGPVSYTFLTPYPTDTNPENPNQPTTTASPQYQDHPGSANFTGVKQLYAGTYLFEVQERNAAGLWSDAAVVQSVVEAVDGIALSLSSVAIAVDRQRQLFVAFESPQYSQLGLTWVSSDSSVAQVSNFGIVTGLNPGHAVITVMLDGTEFVAQCAVTVDVGPFILEPRFSVKKPNIIAVEQIADVSGVVYAILVAPNSTPPTSAEVRNGQSYNEVSILRIASVEGAAGTTVSFTWNGLTAGASYDAYIILEDDYGRLSLSPRKLSVVTPVQDALVLQWDFTGGSLYDLSGSVNHAVLGGHNNAGFVPPVLTADRFGAAGNAYLFNASPDFSYIASTNNVGIVGSAPRTVSLWALNNGSSGFVQFLFGMGTFSSATPTFAAFNGAINNAAVGSEHLLFMRVNISGDNMDSVANIMQRNVWDHWVFTHDGLSTRIYKNGAELVINVIGPKFEVNSADAPFFLATTPLANVATDRGNSSWKGGIDDVKVYNYALNAAQINERYLAERP